MIAVDTLGWRVDVDSADQEASRSFMQMTRARIASYACAACVTSSLHMYYLFPIEPYFKENHSAINLTYCAECV